MGLKWLVCWIGWTNYKGRETIKWVHRGVHGPDPGSWATVIASFAHSVATLLLKRSVSGSWQPDLLMNLTSLSAWFPSSASCVTKTFAFVQAKFSVCPFSNRPHVPFSYSCWRGQHNHSHCLSCLFWQTRGPVLQRSNWALSQLQLPALCRAKRPPSLPGFTDWSSSEQLLHLDGEEAQGTRLVVLCLCMHVHVRRAGHWALLGFN